MAIGPLFESINLKKFILSIFEGSSYFLVFDLEVVSVYGLTKGFKDTLAK